MVKYYHLIRKIHLYAAFIVAAFLFMYFLTGGVMIMEHTFPRRMKEVVKQKMTIDKSLHEREVITSIKKQFNINGFERRIEQSDKIVFNFTKPGYRAQVTLPSTLPEAEINIQTGTFAAVMNSFHRLRGFEGTIHTVWSIFYDLACIALILFAISGLCLWWGLLRNKIPGLILLLVSISLTIFTISYLYAVC